jgi:hypothetical protein
MLYLEEQSEEANASHFRMIAEGTWDYQRALPHVDATLRARDLFSPQKSTGEKRHHLAQHFFDILNMLPQNHIVHDTAIGLQLPEAISEQEWIYLAPDDMTFRSFNSLLGDLFTPFDKISLSGLHGRAGATSEIKATVQHLRGYGDHLKPDFDRFYREAARYAMRQECTI